MSDVPGGPPIPPPEGQPPGFPPPPPGEPAPAGWTLPPPPPGAYEPEAPLPPLQMPPPSFPDLDERGYGRPLRPDGARIRRARRLPPRFDPLMATVGGLLLFVGMTTLLEQLPADSQWWTAAAICVAVLALCFVLANVVRTGPAVSGLLALALPTAALPAGFVLSHEDMSFRTAAAVFFGVPIVLWLVAYLVGPMAGRPVLLAAVLAALWFLASAQIAYNTGNDYFSSGGGELRSVTLSAGSVSVLAQPTPSPESTLSPAEPLQPTPDRAPDASFLPAQPDDFSSPSLAPDGTFVFPTPGATDPGFSDEGFGTLELEGESFDPFEAFFGISPFGFGSDLSERLGFVALGFGLIYLIAAYVLDSRRLSGVATAFVAVADVAIAVGVVFLTIRYPGWAGAGIALGAGFVLTGIGAGLNRRGTAWLGAVGMLVGIGGLVAKATEELSESDDGMLAGLLLLGAGLVALVIAVAVNRGRGDDFGVDPAVGDPHR